MQTATVKRNRKLYGEHNVGAMTRRVLRWYRAASAEQHAAGLAWYATARDACHDMASRYRNYYSPEQVAACMAALSPQVSWEKNLQACADALYLHSSGEWRGESLPGYAGYGENVRKSAAILSGDLDALRGPKVSAFAAAMMGDLSHVVVDVWATRAARDDRSNLLHAYRDREEVPKVREYRAIAEAYRRAARIAGIEPAVMQAIVWVTVRESAQWARPQTLTRTQAARFYKRQRAARERAGLAN